MCSRNWNQGCDIGIDIRPWSCRRQGGWSSRIFLMILSVGLYFLYSSVEITCLAKFFVGCNFHQSYFFRSFEDKDNNLYRLDRRKLWRSVITYSEEIRYAYWSHINFKAGCCTKHHFLRTLMVFFLAWRVLFSVGHVSRWRCSDGR